MPHVWPLLSQLLHKSNTCREAFLLIISNRCVFCKTQLQLDRRHDRSTVSQKRIRDKKPLVFKESQKVNDPIRMRCNHVRRMLQKDLRDHPPMVAQRQRQ